MNSHRRSPSLIPVRIGALLVSSDVLRPPAVQQALTSARNTGKKIGEVLLTQNLVSHEDLHKALVLQRLIKDGDLTVEMGTKALKDSIQRRRPVEISLDQLGWCDQRNIGNNSLAVILLDSGCVTQPQLDQARWNAAQNGMPLGRNLVLYGHITPSTLGCALSALILVRDKKVTRNDAIAALKQAIALHCSLEEVLNLPGVSSPCHVRVGELLSQAGLLSESDAMIAAENSLLNRRNIGEQLMSYNMISPMVLDTALKLQQLVQEGQFSKQQAAGLLRQVAEKNVGLENFLTEISCLKSKVLDLLLESGLITRANLQDALSESPEYETDILRALFASKILSQDLFRAAVRCCYAIDEGTYSREDAITWLSASVPSSDDTTPQSIQVPEEFRHSA